MKRRMISFMTALVLCLGLCPGQVLAAGWEPDDFDFADMPDVGTTVNQDTTIKRPFEISWDETFDTCGHSYSSPDTTVLIIKNGGRVYLTYGTIESGNGTGIEIQGGGFLCVKDPGMNVIGTEYSLDIQSGAEARIAGGTFEGGMYGLRIESGAKVRISGGTFTGEDAAIWMENDSYGDLLVTGYAFFDEDDKVLRPEEMSGAKRVLQVRKCVDHVYGGYTANPGEPTHNGTCVYCGETADLECEFNLNGNTSVKCADCAHVLTITIDKDKLIYNGIDKPNIDAVKVELDNSTPLTVYIDYTVKYSSRVDGEITVTVTSTSKSHAWTYTESFSDTRAKPEISWASFDVAPVPYSGNAVEKTDLPNVIISYTANDDDKADLEQNHLYFSYSADGDAHYIEGLPTDAGRYQIKAHLSASQNYQYAESAPVTLEITKINPIIDPPEAVTVTYDRYAHELVTPGSVWPGAVIQFARTQGGPWSESIPTETNAGEYEIWYKVDGTNNYENVLEGPITAQIQKRWIEPSVSLNQTSFVYDNAPKEPSVTIKDPSDGNWDLHTSEYKVEYADNQNVGTATATVSPSDNSNYDFNRVICRFTISKASQDGLSITGQPNQVFYGDVFTLSTTGGSGSGTVTWEIIDAKNAAGGAPASFVSVAKIDPDSGQITVNGLGSFTVQAKKSGKESDADGNGTTNREDTTAEVTFHVDPRPVTATVTAESKTYDGTNTATVSAKVEQGVVLGDTITITGVTGEFSDENAGTGKTVTVSIENAVIDAPAVTIGDAPDEKTFEKYVVTIPTTPVTADITPEPLGEDDLTVSLDCYSYTYDGSEKKPVVTVTVKDGSAEIPPKEYTVAYSNNVNVGTKTAKAIVTDNPGGNYTIETVEVPFSIITGGQAVLTSSPQARDLTYNGKMQDLVTVGTATGGSLVYALKTGDTEPTDYYSEIPQGDSAGEYIVCYKVEGDDNHGDSAVYYVYVTIKPKTVTSPVIELAASRTFTYDGKPQTFVFNEPGQANEITVKDGDDEIPATEYDVTYSNNVNAGTATVHIVDKNGGNYNVSGSKPFQIEKATAKFDPEPTGKPDLTYNGEAQELIIAGLPKGGTAYYWLDGGAYSTSLPTGTNCDTYYVYAMVQGDENHNDSEPMTTPIKVTINKNTVDSPTIELSASNFQYNGSEQKPTVTVKDDKGYVIPVNEYTVTYEKVTDDSSNPESETTVEVEPGDIVGAGKYYVVIKSKNEDNCNYSFTTKRRSFTITEADQTPLAIIGKPSVVYYGDTLYLGTTGGSGNGAVTWSVEPTNGAINGNNGQFKITGVGNIKIKATRTSANYANTEDTWEFYAYRKPVNAVVTVKSRDYDETTNAEIESITVPEAGEIMITFKEDYKDFVGRFADKDVGTNKLVTFTITADMLDVINGENYEINYPTTAVASITPAAVTVNETNEPTENKGSDGNNLVYNGQEQPLLALPAGAVLDGGSWAYSTDGTSYGPSIPKGENAGTYEVWYKVIPDSNHKFDTVLDPVTVTIEKKAVAVTVTCSPETFPYDGTEKTPNVFVTYQDDDGSTQMISDQEYTVEFPEERTKANAEDENYTVTVTANADGNYEFTNNSAKGTFTILPIDQAPLAIVTEKPGFVYYNDTFKLSAVGGSGTGEIIWEIVAEKGENGLDAATGTIATITEDGGVVTVNGVGSFTVTAYREKTEGSYKESDRDSITFTVRPKPVTAVVTAQDKEYDGSAAADLTVTVPDAVGITVEVDSTYKGTFDNANVGTGKIVTFKTISENVTVDGKAGNYDITYPTETTASITPAAVTVNENNTPKVNTGSDGNGLVYNGQEQTLLTLPAGADLDGGFWAYSTNGVDYNRLIPETIPTGKNAGTYRIWYKVIPDSNHKFDTVLDPVTVTIEKKAVAVTVTCSPETFPYDGNPKTPTVTVKDADGNVISADEYTVEYPQDSYSMGEHKVKITSKGNYEFTNDPEGTFKITSAAQSRLTIVYNQDRTVYFGDNFWVSASGGLGTGGIQWGIENGADDTETIAVITPDSEMSERAKVSVEGVGSFTVTAYRDGDSSYSQSEPATMTFTALPKPVTAIVTAENKTYDSSNVAKVHVTWEDGALINGDIIDTSEVTGTFASADVGEKIVVNITGRAKEDATSKKYDIEIPSTTTATISIAKAEINGEPTAASGTIYAGDNVPLIVVSDVTTNFGEIVYALENPYEKQEEQDDMLDEDLDDYEDLDPDPPGLVYTADIPTAKEITKAGTYTVWYKIKPTDNWAGTEPKPVSVTVKDKEAGTSGGTSPGSAPSQAPSTSQTSRPSTDNSSDTSSGTNTSQTTTKPGTGSVSMQTSVQDKTASTVLDSAAGSQLVNEAVANKSTNVVIKPEITGDVSKTEVSIPASAVSRIGNETDAALTVSTPVADVTIPNASLDTLSSAGGAVSVVTERVENTVVLTLNADGKDIGDIPGGLTLTVPSENATPGTVAVLIHEDGTREIIRKSVAEDGSVRIPLNGSATVEIVDNSKQFADVPAESWAADAVAFASAHEILNGTGEAMFSPEVSMSRAMLATVLYNLEGCPDQELTGAFSDVSSDAWYAAGVSWAAANGITSGYGDGQYGPNDNITREQLAVMLWRYMESPAADKQVPDFTDTDQASSYAMEALYWAAANGIVNGYGNGQLDPSGPATRAQAAQMLKNFIENT